MSGFLDSLNLRPQERRFVVVVAVVVFVVLNIWLVWPHFSDWGRLTRQLNKDRSDIASFKKEIALDEDPANGYRKKLISLQAQGGNKVLMSEENQLRNTIHDEAAKAGVTVNRYDPVPSLHGQSNEFFEEQSERIQTESDEAQLIAFLYQVGQDSSMIRVRELDLKPVDQNRYRLRGNMTLTANYQKKPVTTPSPAAMTTKAVVKAPQMPPTAQPKTQPQTQAKPAQQLQQPPTRAPSSVPPRPPPFVRPGGPPEQKPNTGQPRS